MASKDEIEIEIIIFCSTLIWNNKFILSYDPNPDLFTNDYNDISWNNTILSDKV